MFFRKYLMTPAEEVALKLDIANEQLRILEILMRIYRKNPTEQLENSIREIKTNYDIYKKSNNL